MRRAASTAALLAVAASVGGCPWNDPCWNVACGERCTLCAHDDATCMQAEQPRYCDANGTCVAVLDPTASQQPGFCAVARP